ncbi:MAG: hypothetical protein HXY41_10625 [Chloroflexi bacterium]|nr:hypothetical protein [Chloroflexota bacterium]
MSDTQSPLDYFRFVLLTVVGQAFEAAGYRLDENPVQWAGGLFRFSKPLENGLYGFIEFQLLNYTDTPWASGNPSRFRVILTRSDRPSPAASPSPLYARRPLDALVVQDFGVAILPSADHWWTFRSTQQLGSALAEAGHLVVGYGIPWLAGDLLPPSV